MKGWEIGRLEAGFAYTGGNVLAVMLSTGAVKPTFTIGPLMWTGTIHDTTTFMLKVFL